MPAPITPDKRAAIEQALRSNNGQRSRAAIAREHGVAASTVGKIQTQANIDAGFDRTQTENATRAKTADNAERRAMLAAAMLDDVEFLRGKFRQDWSKTVVVPGIGSDRVEADDAEIATGLQRLMTAVGIAIDKHVALEKHDAGSEGIGQATSVIEGIMGALRAGG